MCTWFLGFPVLGSILRQVPANRIRIRSESIVCTWNLQSARQNTLKNTHQHILLYENVIDVKRNLEVSLTNPVLPGGHFCNRSGGADDVWIGILCNGEYCKLISHTPLQWHTLTAINDYPFQAQGIVSVLLASYTSPFPPGSLFDLLCYPNEALVQMRECARVTKEVSEEPLFEITKDSCPKGPW